jgi:hypothetical protein
MNITINIVELATELADHEVQEHFKYSSIPVYDEDEYEIRYSDEAQDIFDELYDKYYAIIEHTKVNS